MTLRQTLDPNALPPKPSLTLLTLVGPLQRQRLRLRQLEFVDGFAPLSLSLLIRVRRLEIDWSNHCWTAKREVHMARRAGKLDAVLTQLAEQAHARYVDGHSTDSGIDRHAPDGTGSSTAQRLVALGRSALADEPQQRNFTRAFAAGRIAVLALLRDAAIDDALHLARQWHRYDSALADLVARIERALCFLGAEQTARRKQTRFS